MNAYTSTSGINIGQSADSGVPAEIQNGGLDAVYVFNISLSTDDISTLLWANGAGSEINVSLLGLPQIDSYNMTSEGGCTYWNTNKNNACSTTDTTPTVFIKTDIDAYCAIGIQDLNYNNLGENRSCSGGGTKAHTCTLTAQESLKETTSYLYIGCKNLAGNQGSSSTSGALNITILVVNIESSSRDAIEAGIQAALTSGYTIYTDQKIYARNSANQQAVGVFDKVVKWMNKIWAFNYIAGSDSYSNMFNITPVLYTLEMQNISFAAINSTVYQLITSTK